MIHTDEDDEFGRIAHEIEMKSGQPYHFDARGESLSRVVGKKQDDDDIQDYVRPWVGLTDQEIEQMGLSNYIKVVREVEAKLKEKNHG
jgi:hypothetical protein